MRLFGIKLNALLVMALAALLALGAISVFADDAPGDPPGDVVTVDEVDTDGDVDGDADGDADGDVDGDTDGDVGALSHGEGPNPDRGCATGSLDHARGVLEALLLADHPGENEGIRNALEKMCHGETAEVGTLDSGGGDGGDGEAHPGNGHAFGRGHGQGKPEGVPADGDEE